ncbi:MAG: SDR family NAD(P)-dependent oxidoreductase, partial [Candidatus Aminicenantes bacterium]
MVNKVNKREIGSAVTGLEVAVIGIAGRFPGARNLEEFWNNLKEGEESITFFSDTRLEEAGIDPGRVSESHYIKAVPLMDDADCFDAPFFGYTASEAEVLDPQARILLECAWEALEDSGYNPGLYKELIGVYAGASGNFQWEGFWQLSDSTSGSERFARWQLFDKDFLTTAISYRLNLKGPSTTIYTACSTSLVAIHTACRAVLSGECKMALAGGATAAARMRHGYLYQEGMITSPDGHCRAFDARAKGTIFGDGAGMVLLKRLKYAISDGDHIYAVIKGSAINNDGSRKVGYAAPSIEGQSEVIRLAQRIARVEPESITYVETHGTGTPLGDPVEIEGLKLAFNTQQRHFCGIGSVKTNFGHLDIAAGIAGFIKTVLAISQRMIPPSLHFETPNPKIDFENSPFYVNTELKEWKNDKYPLRAGVSSFGIGGTNAHVILEEAPEGTRGLAPLSNRKYQLILLSAKTAAALDQVTKNFVEDLKKKQGINLADAAYTLQMGRKVFKHRRMLVAATAAETMACLSSGAGSLSPGPGSPCREPLTFRSDMEKREVIFMFPGQGAQYVNMGLDLYRTEPVFREEMDCCFEILKSLMGYDIKEIIYPSDRSDQSDRSDRSDILINQTEITQPVLFIFEYALAKLLIHWGIKPYAMIGHSIGEYVAACLSGVFSLEDALKLVVLRGKLMQNLPKGAMLGVSLAEEELAPFLGDDLALAAVNSSSYCAVAGSGEAVERLEKQLEQKGCQTRRLHTSHAFHSNMMDPILAPFKESVKQIKLSEPGVPYISNVSGGWITTGQAVDPGYWAAHLRCTVRFAQGLALLLEKENIVFVEVGPGQGLSTFVRQHNNRKPRQKIVNLVRHPKENQTDSSYLLSKIGQLWLYSVTPDWRQYYSHEKRLRVSLPTYPFERQQYPMAKDPFAMIGEKIHGKIRPGKRTDLKDWFYIPSWKRSLVPGPLIEESPDGAKIKQLFFMDSCGIGSGLIEWLRQGKHTNEDRVIVVEPGHEFARVSRGRYTIHPGHLPDYQALLSELGTLGRIPERIVHLWNVTGTKSKDAGREPGAEPGEEFERYETYQERGFYSLVYLARAIGDQPITKNIHIVVLTNRLQEATGEEELEPQKATVLGPAMTISREYPNISCQCIDIVLPGPGSREETRLIRQLAAELLSPYPDKMIAYRHQHRLVQTFEPVLLTGAAGKIPCLREKGVYLVTGGLGGIGLVLAEHLAGSVHARLVLIGRSSFPTGDRWDQWLQTHPQQDETSRKIQKLQEIKAAGAEVLVFRADVSDYHAMQAVISRVRDQWGTINGVIHCAGIPGGGVIQRKNREDAEKVLAPKVKGTLVLDYILRDINLDFFVLCSSINSVVPILGQVDYYAANAFLDAFAHYKTAENSTFTVSINWDTWQAVGMAVEAARQQREKNRRSGHPLLDQYIPGEPSQVAYLTCLDFNKHWVLNEHRTPDKKGLLPGTAYLEMVRAAFAAHRDNGNPGEEIIEIRDVQFRNPLMIPEDETREIALILKQQDQGFHFSITSRVNNREKNMPGQLNHTVGNIFKIPAQKPITYNIKEIKARCSDYEVIINRKEDNPSSSTSSGGLLDFGPRWKNLMRINYGKNEALALLQLDEKLWPDLLIYKLHPALLDTAAAFLYHHLDKKNAYIPLSYKRLTISGDLPGRLFSYSRLRENRTNGNDLLEFDVTLMDEQGKEIVDIEGFAMLRVSPEVKKSIHSAASGDFTSGDIKTDEFDIFSRPLAHEDVLKNGILPTEGIDAFSRILGRSHSQVVVSTADLLTRIREREVSAVERLSQARENTGTPTLSRPEMNTPYVAPTTGTEEMLAETWKELLGIKEVGILDDFFELGGDSLKALSVGGRIHKASNVNVPLAEFFNRPTIKQMAQYITSHAEKTRFFSIEPVEKKEYYVLSSAQQRLYILHQMDPGSLGYNLTESVVLEGGVDKEKLETLFRQITARHESFRTSFAMVNREPVQRIHDEVEFEIEYFDLYRTPAARSRQLVTSTIKNFIRPFDLSRPPLIRVGMIEQEDEKYIMIVDVHHIIHDGTSQTIFLKEFMTLYSPGGEELPGLTIQYKDYAEWRRRDKGNEVLRKQAGYWIKEFETDVPVLNLPLDYPRPALQSYDGQTIRFELGAKEAKGLKTLARAREATLFMIILSIYYILLSKLSGQEDIVVGTPTAGRKHPDLHPIIGMFLNTLALRNYPVEHKTFSWFLQEVKDMTLQAFDNQDYPFEDLVEQVTVNRDLSRSPLFDVMFILHNELQVQPAAISEPARKGLKLKSYEYEKTTSQFDLTLVGFEGENHLLFKVEYCTKLFKEESVRRFINYFKEIVSLVLKNPQIKLSGIEIIPQEEKNQILYDFNKTGTTYPKDKTLHELFREQVERTPDHIAVIGMDHGPWTMEKSLKYITYRELNKKADQLAFNLKENGVKPGTIAAIMVSRTMRMMPGLLGILKAGGTYLPLDPEYPEARIKYIIEKSSTSVLVTQKNLIDKFKDGVFITGEIIDIFDESLYREIPGEKIDNRARQSTAAAPAYVIYTSGSTGNPKGVMVQHKNAVNFITGMASVIDFLPGKSILALTTISFDIFFLETLLPVTRGM